MSKYSTSREPGMVAAVSLAVALCVAITAALTIIHVWDFQRDCSASGGRTDNVGTTLWCLHGSHEPAWEEPYGGCDEAALYPGTRGWRECREHGLL